MRSQRKTTTNSEARTCKYDNVAMRCIIVNQSRAIGNVLAKMTLLLDHLAMAMTS
jgi:hypothetical protein